MQQGIVRVRVTGSTASEVARIGLGNRIREVEEGPNGSLWVLRDGDGGALVELTPQ
jgi:glucose/arabinose dehydrogenase